MKRPIVDGETLLARIAELASVGATPSGGVTRDAFSKEFVEGRNLLARWFSAAGLDTSVDPTGNLLGRRRGRHDSPAVMIGSHLDTVRNGGALDGAYGILGGLSAIEALDSAEIGLEHPIALAAFVNEEGARGTPAMTGSRAVVGYIVPEDLAVQDESGRTVADLVADIGGEPKRLAKAAWPKGSIAAYIELHIEQGPILERQKTQIGIVTTITGRVLIDLEVIGKPTHAGTTPMKGRRDALAAAAELVLAIESLGSSGDVRVATTGVIRVDPGSRNTIPGGAHLCAEIRDEVPDRMARAVDILSSAAHQIEASRGVSVTVNVLGVVDPCATDPELRRDFETAAKESGFRSAYLPSGAGHDAQSFSEFCPMGILFVPSVDGISHAPDEHTKPEDLVGGATVLAQTLIHIDHRL